MAQCRMIVVGGHTRNVGKTQLVCELIAAFPDAHWTAGKITQFGHGVCARNGENCGCAPDDHVAALDWESQNASGKDSARFVAAGAQRSFWLRTKQGHLAEGLLILRRALSDGSTRTNGNELNLVIESNSLLRYFKPSLYFAILDPSQEDFKDSARAALDRADAFVLRGLLNESSLAAPFWTKVPARLLRQKPSVVQREGDGLPAPLQALVQRVLQASPTVSL
jgi:hypothetical protein